MSRAKELGWRTARCRCQRSRCLCQSANGWGWVLLQLTSGLGVLGLALAYFWAVLGPREACWGFWGILGLVDRARSPLDWLLCLGFARTDTNWKVSKAGSQGQWLEEGLQSVTLPAWWSSPKWLLSVSVFPGRVLDASTSLRGSPRSANVSDLVSFQITYSVQGLRAGENLCAPFKSIISVSYYPIAFLYINPTGFQSQTFWRLLSPCRTQDWGALGEAGIPWTLGRTSAIVLPSMGHLPQGVGHDYIASLSLLPISLWFLFLTLKKYFLLVFRSSSSIVVL